VLGQNTLANGYYQLLREYKVIQVDSTVNGIAGEITSITTPC
jgi:hypothetical protein